MGESFGWQTPAESARSDDAVALLEDVPIVVLRLDRRSFVDYANRAAREFFRIDATKLPLTVIETTREARIEEAIRGRRDGPSEIRLVHTPATVRVQVSSLADRQLVFIEDVTELRRLERVRQEFIANLSHELKTPLASLSLAAESLLHQPPPEVARRFAQRAVDESIHLAAILDNLRQLTEIEAGRMTLAVTQFRLRDLLDEVRERSRPGPNLVYDVPDLVLEGDRPKIAQALSNLVDNAVKFSPADTPIEIHAVRLGDELVVSVRDHGPGISPEHWDKVFERFYKVDPSRTRDLPGSGLGLAITKHLVLAHRGRIWTYAAPDGGQVFSIALPMSTFTVA